MRSCRESKYKGSDGDWYWIGDRRGWKWNSEKSVRDWKRDRKKELEWSSKGKKGFSEDESW